MPLAARGDLGSAMPLTARADLSSAMPVTARADRATLAQPAPNSLQNHQPNSPSATAHSTTITTAPQISRGR
jgi:hypothetical protein